MRVVLDTSILVAAVRSPAGASNMLLRSVVLGNYQLLLSVPLALEYEAVLKHVEHLTASRMTSEEVDALVDTLIQVSQEVVLARRLRPLLRDPDDEMVLETAVNGRADVLITLNRRDFATIAPIFGIEVLSPKQFWQRVKDI